MLLSTATEMERPAGHVQSGGPFLRPSKCPHLIPNHIFPPPDVAAHIHPERHEKVHNQRRPHRDERGVNEVLAHLRRSKLHPFAEVLAHAKSAAFDQIFEPVLHGKLDLGGKSTRCACLCAEAKCHFFVK